MLFELRIFLFNIGQTILTDGSWAAKHWSEPFTGEEDAPFIAIVIVHGGSGRGSSSNRISTVIIITHQQPQICKQSFGIRCFWLTFFFPTYVLIIQILGIVIILPLILETAGACVQSSSLVEFYLAICCLSSILQHRQRRIHSTNLLSSTQLCKWKDEKYQHDHQYTHVSCCAFASSAHDSILSKRLHLWQKK